MVLNGCKLSFFVQIQYYWRILQSYFYVYLYRKELCNNKFNNIAIWRYAISIAALLNGNPRTYAGVQISIFPTQHYMIQAMTAHFWQ